MRFAVEYLVDLGENSERVYTFRNRCKANALDGESHQFKSMILDQQLLRSEDHLRSHKREIVESPVPDGTSEATDIFNWILFGKT